MAKKTQAFFLLNQTLFLPAGHFVANNHLQTPHAPNTNPPQNHRQILAPRGPKPKRQQAFLSAKHGATNKKL